jgi:RNA polymerase sigma factor (sigma-70 family)
MTDRTLTVEALAAHLGWARRLARSLIHVVEEADDVVQEAWIAAWRRPPSTDGPLRSWLGRVLLNRARNRLRGDRRRAERERGAEVAESPTPEELTARIDVQRELAECFLAPGSSGSPRAPSGGSGPCARGPFARPARSVPPYYQLVADEDRDRPEAMAVLRRFADPLQGSGLFQDCERRFPARGRLVLQLRLTYPQDSGLPRLEHDYSGDLSGSPLARCIAAGLQAAAARFEVPPYSGGAVIKAKLDFPGARPAP